MPFPYDADDLASIARLNLYNGAAYDVGSNPYGFALGGHRVKFEAALEDVARVAQAVADAASTPALTNFQGAWSSGTTYALGYTVYRSGAYYVSQQASNTNHDPATDTAHTWWAPLYSAQATVTVAIAGTRGARFADYICDGTADEVQINAAIVAQALLGGGLVQLLAGTYFLAAGIYLSDRVMLAGEGESTIVKAVGGSGWWSIACDPAVRSANYCTVRDIVIDRDSVSDNALVFKNCTGCRAIRIRTKNITHYNFWMYGAADCIFLDCTADSVTDNGFELFTTSRCMVIGCRVKACTLGHAFNVWAGSSHSIIADCIAVMENNGASLTAGFVVQGNVSIAASTFHTTFINCQSIGGHYGAYVIGDATAADDTSAVKQTANTIFVGCQFLNYKVGGAYVNNGVEELIFDSCTLNGLAASERAFNLYNNTATVRGVTINNCRSRSGKQFLAAKRVDNLTISNCSAKGLVPTGAALTDTKSIIVLAGGKYADIHNNRLIDNGTAANPCFGICLMDDTGAVNAEYCAVTHNHIIDTRAGNSPDAVGMTITTSDTGTNNTFLDNLEVPANIGCQVQTFTPTWVAASVNPTIGNGSISARIERIGKCLKLIVNITMGSTTTYGTGVYVFTLAGTIWTAYLPLINATGTARALDAGTAFQDGVVKINTSGNIDIISHGGSGGWSPTVPHTWAVGDEISFEVMYPIAN